MPQLNERIAGEEADLSWRKERLILEIDGGPFHVDVSARNARKQRVCGNGRGGLCGVWTPTTSTNGRTPLIALGTQVNVSRRPSHMTVSATFGGRRLAVFVGVLHTWLVLKVEPEEQAWRSQSGYG